MIRKCYDFLTFMMRLTNGKLGVAMTLNVLASFTEGISLFLLIPLIALIDADGTAALASMPLVGDAVANFNPSLEVLLISFVVLIAVQAAFIRMKTLYLTKVMLRAVDKLRYNFFVRAGGAHWSTLQQSRVADLQTMLTLETGRIQLATSNLTSLLQSLILLTVYFLLAALVSWQMALLAAGIGLIMLVLLYPMRRKASVYGAEMGELFREQNETLLDFLTGLRVAKSFSAEDGFNQKFARRLKAVRHNAIGFLRLSSASSMAFQIMSALAAVVFIWAAVSWAELDLARIVVLLLIFIRLAPRFGSIQSSVETLLVNLPAYENLTQATRKFADAAEPRSPTGASAPEFKSALRFDQVSFAYPGSDEPAIEDICFEVPAGQFTALIGPSGSGKSTIADLVMGLQRPTQGAIFVDDEKITDDNRRLWRGAVAFVPQEPFLLNDTIAANLRIASPDASDEELWAALERSKADKFIRAMADGIETLVGERGTRLSGGERQRVALARALLRNPTLLILDEATSALDWENQQAISRDIEGMRGEITILTIAHRPSMIRFADKVIALEHGQIVEEGGFEKLASDPNSRLSKMLAGEGAGAD